ncbi:UPF0496 protein [Melia azedarach]|uniref:UPF0496 protein n=1 Tax=Melia azedarach TaxID=155640 RepID=A0ACC1WQ41_MELAZ|nr:UPF0496 protein [Melia azedarach]
MWAKLRPANPRKDDKELRDARKSLNVNEEYLSALRTKSYAEFFTKAQLFVNDIPSSSPSYFQEKTSAILLEPDQETIPTIVESAVLSKVPELKALVLNYFDITSEASSICAQILNNISHIQYQYKFIQQTLDTIDDDHHHSPENNIKLITSKLNSFMVLNNPFTKIDFNLIHDKYSSALHHLKSKRKKIARKIKMIKYVNKATGICITAACSLIAITAVVLAAHTLTAILMGPMIFSFPTKCFRKKLFSFRFMRSGFLTKVREQLDVAAKGTYILNRDFETMGRLVARLHDEVEHSKGMVRFCLDRREDKFSFHHVMKVLKKNNAGFQKQVEELEEHVYLCLVSINRARTLVMKEMMKTSSVEEFRY